MRWPLRGLVLAATLLVTVTLLYLPQRRQPLVHTGVQKYFTVWTIPLLLNLGPAQPHFSIMGIVTLTLLCNT